MNSCCCGRIEDCTEPVIFNERVHEKLGPSGNFCGPVYRHTIRDLENNNDKLRDTLGLIHDLLDRQKEPIAASLRSICKEGLEDEKS